MVGPRVSVYVGLRVDHSSPVRRSTKRNSEISIKLSSLAFSALTLLVGRQEGHPACKKTEWWGAGVAICLERGADLHTAQLMPLPLTCLLLQ